MITRKLRFFYWVLSDGPSWAEMLCLSTGGMLNNLPLQTGPSRTLSCMVGFWHWHIPTFNITDTFPPWWDFVMVGICWQAIIISIIVIIVWQWGPAEQCEASLLCVRYSHKSVTSAQFYSSLSLSSVIIIIINDHQWSSLDPVEAFAFWKSFSFQSPSFTAQYKVSLSLNCTFTVEGTFRVHRDNKTQTTTFSSGIAAGLRWAAC